MASALSSEESPSMIINFSLISFQLILPSTIFHSMSISLIINYCFHPLFNHQKSNKKSSREAQIILVLIMLISSKSIIKPLKSLLLKKIIKLLKVKHLDFNQSYILEERKYSLPIFLGAIFYLMEKFGILAI